jgi:hypothetical protein
MTMDRRFLVQIENNGQKILVQIDDNEQKISSSD